MNADSNRKINGQLLMAMILLAVTRILLSVLIGIWFAASQTCDDRLMIAYADLSDHFNNFSHLALVKDLSFSVFLKVTSLLKLPYPVIMASVWVVAAFTVYEVVFELLGKRKLIAFLTYVYTLFMPQAFDVWSGTRLYRNGIIAPFVIITLSLMIRMVKRAGLKKRALVNSIILGLVFSFTYYIKEDGLWLMACLIFSMVLSLAYVIKTKVNAKKIVNLLIPLGIFFAITITYKTVNYKYFGVFEINTRTDSEFGEFAENLYKIDSENRSMYIWTPYDTLEKAFAASPTLSEHPKLLESVMTSIWCDNDLKANPLKGDHVMWALRDSLLITGMYTSEADMKEFFKNVNDELDEAFKNGSLKKQEGVIWILASTGGYTKEEVKSLREETIEAFKGAVFLKGYLPGISVVSEDDIFDNYTYVQTAEEVTNVNYLMDTASKKIQSDKIVPVINVINIIYKILNTVLFFGSLIFIVYSIVSWCVAGSKRKEYTFKHKESLLCMMAGFVFFGISVCYAFSISWFVAFLFEDGINMITLNFYSIALPGLLSFAYIFELLGAFKLFAKRG